MFEKGRKKSTKGLYRLKFQMEREILSKKTGQLASASTDQESVNMVMDEEDDENRLPELDFLCTGFLHLIKEFAD